MSQRTAVIMLVGVIVAGIASVAWAAWKVTGDATGTARAAEVTALRATATPKSSLYPGGRSDIVVRVRNPNEFAVEVQSFASDTDVTVDAAHAAAGCQAGNVTVVPTNNLGHRVEPRGEHTFTVQDAVHMAAAAPQACQGATFQITLALAGVSLPD